MKRALTLASLAFLLAACADESPAHQQGARSDWTVVAADGVSIGEMALRSWCDPGTTLEDVKTSSEGTLNSLRLSAAKVRSAGVASKDDGLSTAHDDLVALAEFAAAVHHLTSITTTDGFIRPDRDLTNLDHLSLAKSAIIFAGLTKEEKDEMRAGKDVSQYEQRVLEQVLQRQRTAVAAATSAVTQKHQAIADRSASAAPDGPALVIDSVVVANASGCVRALVDKRMAVN